MPEWDGRRARQPFRFMDYTGLEMPTGRRAANLRELLEHVRRLPIDVIHHHLHRAPLRHRFGVWDYPNDFARWAATGLEDLALAEKLASLDPYAIPALEQARDAIVAILEDHLDSVAWVPWVRPGLEFHFASGRYLSLPSDREAWTIPELRDGLQEAPLGSLYFHFHEARLRGPADDIDDFSRWIRDQFGPLAMLEEIRRIDFYFYSLEDLRARILRALE